jgi:hypothetical protein
MLVVAILVLLPGDSLDSTTDQLPQVTGNDPKRQVFATRSRWRERHDSSRFRDIPSAGTDTCEETTQDQVPLVSKFGVAIVRRASNGERASTDD